MCDRDLIIFFNSFQVSICLPPGTYRLAMLMLSDKTAMPQRLIEVALTDQSCNYDDSAAPETRTREIAMAISKFSSYSQRFSWICRSGWPQAFDGGGESSGEFLTTGPERPMRRDFCTKWLSA